MGGAEGERSRPEPGSGSGAGSGSGPDADEPDRPERPGEREEPGLADRADSVDALVRVVEEQRRAEARARIRFLEHGLIDQAVGVLVAQLSCGPDEAFGQLLELERRSGSGLLEIAGELVGRGVQGEPAGGLIARFRFRLGGRVGRRRRGPGRTVPAGPRPRRRRTRPPAARRHPGLVRRGRGGPGSARPGRRPGTDRLGRPVAPGGRPVAADPAADGLPAERGGPRAGAGVVGRAAAGVRCVRPFRP